MKIAVLGGGMVGSLIATELSGDYDVTTFDKTKLHLHKVKSVIRDVTQEEFRKEISEYDIAINCLPGFMGFNMLKTLVDIEVSCIDISFMPEDSRRLFHIAENNGVTAITDAGVAPGLSNLIFGRELSEYDHLDTYLEIHAGAGGTESQDWAHMLARMYSKWIEKKKCKFENLEILCLNPSSNDPFVTSPPCK